MKRRILALSHDPGGAKAMAPVLAFLRAHPDRYELRVLASSLAAPIFAAHSVASAPMETNVNAAAAAAWFDGFRPHLAFTGTSWNSNAEQRARNEAARRGIPSFALLDFWSNYAVRWRDSEYELACMPDKVLVMDQATCPEMTAEGFPRAALLVTGQPFLEEIFALRREFRDRRVERMEKIVLFLSQPYGFLNEWPIHPLRMAAAEIEKLNAAEGRKYSFHVRLHPKEIASIRLRENLAQRHFPLTRVEFVPAAMTIDESLAAADFVIGYNTIALFEARSYGMSATGLEIYAFNPALASAMRAAGIAIVPPRPNSLRAVFALPPEAANTPSFHAGALDCVLRAMSLIS